MTVEVIDIHKCDEEDYALFHKVEAADKERLQNMKDKNMFFCLNRKDRFGEPVKLELFGDFIGV